ncbi:MAG: hypothetical protein HNEKOMLI_00345 [Sodalis sp. Psp]|nr:hypothetical protein [Sodalis sp. Psp]MCR3756835.1 hypothetical protein [Sodalis sp. Ppy]
MKTVEKHQGFKARLPGVMAGWTMCDAGTDENWLWPISGGSVACPFTPILTPYCGKAAFSAAALGRVQLNEGSTMLTLAVLDAFSMVQAKVAAGPPA